MMRATRSMQAASATLDPPNLWTFQACTLRSRSTGFSVLQTLELYLFASRRAN
jgi:hypothetical protein